MTTPTPTPDPDDTYIPRSPPVTELDYERCPTCRFGLTSSAHSEPSLRCQDGHEFTPTGFILCWRVVVHEAINAMRMAALAGALAGDSAPQDWRRSIRFHPGLRQITV